MTTATAKKILEANSDRIAVFISDSTQGDQIIVTQNPVLLPKTCEGTDVAHAGEFLRRLDFEVYEGNGPKVTVHRV